MAKVRRYCVANRVYRHLTVTFAVAVGSRAEVLAACAAFRRRLFAWAGCRFPMVVVPEQGEKYGRWHAEIGLGRFVPVTVLRELWGLGHVSIVRYGDWRKVRDEVAFSRQCGGYLAKYVAKAFLEVERVPGQHRYEVAQGFQPDSEVFDVDDLDEGFRVAVAYFGGELPKFVWSSAQEDFWPGLPVYFAFW